MASRPIALSVLSGCLIALLAAGTSSSAQDGISLEQGFRDPPSSARIRCFWWWLNGNVTKEAITRDLEEMNAKGFGGAMIFDAGGASQRGNRQVPPGPTFATPPWRELFRHAVREAGRLGLELSLNIQSGWNLGGPNVSPEEAAQQLVWSETRATGPMVFEDKLPAPTSRDGFYRDVRFDPAWGGPASVRFEDLISWTERPEDGIKYYSGTATYRTTFDRTGGALKPNQRLVLDLGDVRDVGIARVRLNGKDLGVVWAPPFRVDVTGAIKPSGNRLEVDVVNSWRNRLVGDRDLPEAKRLTRTNITIRKEWRLRASGLLGPVQILAADEPSPEAKEPRE